MRTRWLCLISAVASLGLGSVSGANLIVNGDFETGSTDPFVISAGTNNDSVGITSQGSYGAGSAAKDGKFLLGFNAGSDNHGGYAYQSFATTPGEDYTVQFDIGTNNGGPGQTMDYNVYDITGVGGGTVLASGSAFTNKTNDVDTNSFTFTADSANSTLQFVDDAVANAGRGGSSDLVLDNVSVTPVPEPASIALLGLGALGLLARRRRMV